MAWSIVGVGTAVTTTTVTHSLVEPAGVAAGDLLVACISHRGVSSTSVTLPSGWTRVNEQKSGNAVVAAATSLPSSVMAYIVRGSSAPGLDFTLPVANAGVGRIVAYRSDSGTPTFDVSSSATTATSITSINVTGFTSTGTDELLVGMLASGRSSLSSAFKSANAPSTASSTTNTTSAPSTTAWTERADGGTASGAGANLSAFDAVKSVAGATGNFTATFGASTGHSVIAGAFKAVAAAGGVTVNATGQAATASAGVVSVTATSPNVSIAATGVQALSSVGTVTVTAGGAAGGPWTPTELPTGQVGWYDAADAGTLTFSGSNLTQWRDRSAAARHMGPAGPTGPTLTTINSLGSLLFNDQALQTSSTTTFGDWTMFAVFKPGSSPFSYERIADHGFTTGWWFGREGVSTNWGGGVIEGSAPYGRYVALANGQVHQISNKRSGTTHTVSGNGGALSTNGTVTGAATGAERVFIGDDNTSSAGSLGLVISEILVYSTALATDDQAKVEGYLAWKWGIQASLPGGHPYKSAAPTLPGGGGAVNVNVDAIGQAVAGAVGTATATGKANVTTDAVGVAATGASGTVTVAGKANLTATGVSAAGATGIASIATTQAVTVTPVGQAATAAVGGVSVAVGGGISVTPTNVSAAALTGTATVVAKQVIGVAATGAAATALAGTVSVAGKANVTGTGVAAAALTGTAGVTTTRAATVVATGVTAPALTGGVSVSVGGGVSITPTGVTTAALTGTAAVSAIRQVTVPVGGGAYGPDESLYPPAAATEGQAPSVLSLGSRIGILSNGRITHIRYWRASGMLPSRTVMIWSDAGALLFSTSTTGAPGWNLVPVSPPLNVSASDIIRVAYGYAGSASDGNFGFIVSEAVHADTTNLDFISGCYHPGGSADFPDTIPGDASNYYADIVYEEGVGGGYAAVAAAGAVSIAGSATIVTTGQVVTAVVGTATVATTRTALIAAAGVDATALTGGVSVATGGSVSLTATGVAATALAGTATVTARQMIGVTPAGVAAAAQVRSPIVTTTALGGMKVWTGSAWSDKPARVWTGSAWMQKPIKVWNGSAWT